jgi:hypothetical protein
MVVVVARTACHMVKLTKEERDSKDYIIDLPLWRGLFLDTVITAACPPGRSHLFHPHAILLEEQPDMGWGFRHI